MIRVLAVVVALALMVYALVDCWQRDERLVDYMPRWAWLLVIVVVPVFGPLAYFLLGKGDGSAKPRDGQRPSAPTAPDDDPDYLWKLEQENRRRARERAARDNDHPDDSGMSNS